MFVVAWCLECGDWTSPRRSLPDRAVRLFSALQPLSEMMLAMRPRLSACAAQGLRPAAAASSWFRQETVYSATLTGNAERVKALLQAKREVVAEQLQWSDDVGCCALHRACREGHVECTRLLLDAHADLDAADNVGWQPLHHACSNGRLECARLLLEQFADADATNLRGNTPMHLALMGIGHTGDKLQALLVSHGATSGPPAWLKGDSPPRKPRRERVQKYANEQAPEQAPDAGDDHLKE